MRGSWQTSGQGWAGAGGTGVAVSVLLVAVSSSLISGRLNRAAHSRHIMCGGILPFLALMHPKLQALASHQACLGLQGAAVGPALRAQVLWLLGAAVVLALLVLMMGPAHAAAAMGGVGARGAPREHRQTQRQVRGSWT